MIKFLCPNGHELSAQEELIGKPGKCPKCSVRFVVPDPSSVEPDDSPDDSLDQIIPTGGSSPGMAPPTGSSTQHATAAQNASLNGLHNAAATPGANGDADVAPAKDAGAAKDVIVFLCPNGHRLNGPRSLQGKAGQCPHCGSRFRIPEENPTADGSQQDGSPQDDSQQNGGSAPGTSIDPGVAGIGSAFEDLESPPVGYQADPTEESVVDREYSEEPTVPMHGDFSHGDFSHGDYEADYDLPEDEEDIPEGVEIVEEGFNGPSLAASAARLMTELWSAQSDDWEIELEIAEQPPIVGEQYSIRLSQEAFAVIAAQEDDQSYTITAIPWQEVKRIRVRNVKELPEEF